MELVRGIHDLQARHRGCVLTIGNYDGVHLGHQSVLAGLREKAQSLNCPSTVMVFEPTPQEFFAGARAPARLTTLREKLVLLQAIGVDRVLCVRFDRGVAGMDPAVFIQHLLVDGLGVRHVVVGDDFRFGRDRKGDFQTLVTAGQANGFDVAATPVFLHDGERVSSSAVRAALARGDLAFAAGLLGRDYAITGRVRQGEQLGRRLGYPTANIAPRRRVVPIQGVFAVRVRDVSAQRLSGRAGVDDRGADVPVFAGVASLGTRPMVGGREPLLEVHLFDFEGDLYGRRLEVSFVSRLREERVFSDLHAMVDQMHLDAARAREVLGMGTG